VPDPIELGRQAGDLRIAVVEDGKLVRCDWSGRSVEREADLTLRPFFDRLLARAQALGTAIEMHFEKLEYFNSSTIAALVQFIRAAQRSAVAVTVAYDASQKWQAISFDALKRALRPLDVGRSPSVQFMEL